MALSLSPEIAKYLTLAVFLIAYVLLVAKKGHPLLVVFIPVALLLATGIIDIPYAFRSLNFNVLGILLGMMILSELFIASNVPAYLASVVVSKTRTVGAALLAVCIMAGFISMFVENVATVLIVAPIALEMARKLKISAVPFLIGIAVSSNLQGCATMIGDSPSVLLAVSAKMTFTDFFWMHGKPGIFFAVELGAVASFIILHLFYRKFKSPVTSMETIEVKTWAPTVFLTILLLSLAISSFIPNRPEYTIGALALTVSFSALIWHNVSAYLRSSRAAKAAVRRRSARQEEAAAKNGKRRNGDQLAGGHIPEGPMRLSKFLIGLDWTTFFLLVGLFILVGSLTKVGVIEDIAGLISRAAGSNAFTAYLIIVWVSVLLSAFVDNIPYTLAMLPVAKSVAAGLGMEPYVFMFGLLVGTSLGGNITPIGASANVVSMGLLRKNGYKPTFKEFVAIGLPFTIAAVGIGSTFLWLVWGA